MTYKDKVFHPDSRNGLISALLQILNYHGVVGDRNSSFGFGSAETLGFGFGFGFFGFGFGFGQ